MADNFDDDIAEAIARSLADSEVTKGNPSPLNSEDEYIDEDSLMDGAFDADLQAAILASKAESKQPSIPSAQAPEVAEAGTPTSFLSQRARDEAARLERQKQKRGIHEVDMGTQAERPAKRQSPAPSASTRPTTRKLGNAESSKGAGGPQMYWDGELRHTANRLAPGSRPTFRLTEVIGEVSELSLVILSSYSTDLPWVYTTFFQNCPAPVVFVGQGDNPGPPTIRGVLPNWIKVTPFLPDWGVMHMKFFLLFYNTGRLRVAISTANLMDYDYRDIENSIWVQDIPLRPTPLPPKSAIHEFPARFIAALDSLNVPVALTTHIQNGFPDIPLRNIKELGSRWDWSKIKVKLIVSRVGTHTSWPTINQVGFPALRTAVQAIGAGFDHPSKKGKKLVLECQGSSIGTYTTSWMNVFYDCASGRSPQDWLSRTKSKNDKLPYPSIKILFPSQKTVDDSVLGQDGAGTMFCRENQWKAANFPRHLFHDANSQKGGVMMHSKMIIGLWKDAKTIASSFQTIEKPVASSSKGKRNQVVQEVTSDSETEQETDSDVEIIERSVAGWVYVGSHNFTPSAWGYLSGSWFTPSIKINNYEMGILFPLPEDPEEAEKKATELACFKRPPRKYTASDRPWIQSQ